MTYQVQVRTNHANYQVNCDTLQAIYNGEKLTSFDTSTYTPADLIVNTVNMLGNTGSSAVRTNNVVGTLSSYSVVVVPRGLNISVRFGELKKKWSGQRNLLSSSAWDNVTIPEYEQIIGMGAEAIPLILAELRDELRSGEPDDWFVALWAITGENPVPLDHRGKIREMAEAWIKWGERAGYLDGKPFGASVSVSGLLHRSQLTY
jgi:hypothetical protein